MRRTMRGKTVLFVAIAMVALMIHGIVLPQNAAAGTPAPIGGFQGTISIGGTGITENLVVSAWIDGEKVAETQAVDSTYELLIPGSYEDKVVSFKIGDYDARQTATWTNGTVLNVNLTVNSWVFKCEFYGQVTIDGQHIPDGTEISAWIDSAKVHSTTTINSLYHLVVPGNYTGKAVAFKVGNNYATQIVTWTQGSEIETDLIVSLGPLVCGFYGTATLDGTNVPSGTEVSAWIDGKEVQTTNSDTGTFALNIAGDYTGKTVSFQVGGQATKGSAVWLRGGNVLTPLTSITTGPPTVTIDLSQAELKPGDEFTLTVNVDPNGHGISGGSVDLLLLDPNVIEILVDEVTAGNLLGTDPIEGLKEKTSSSSGESLHYALARTGKTPEPTSPNEFVKIGLRIKGGAKAGKYAIPNAITLTDEAFAELDFDPPTVHITVTGNGIFGDLNGDGSVGLTDLAMLASAYGTLSGEAGFRAGADLNSNGEVDLGDLAILAGNWGS
jgi:hypothetical protein